MDIYVLNQNYERIGVIDNFESVIWNIKYFDCGDFELYTPACCESVALLKRGNCLVRDKDITGGCMYHVMIIEKVQTKTDIENGDHLIITGRDLKSLAGRRIIWEQTILSGKVEVELRRLLTENLIEPNNVWRKIENTMLGELMEYEENISQQVTGDNLLEYIVKTLTTYGMGWDCCVNEEKNVIFQFYKGIDRSADQNEMPQVIFSPYNENILNSDHFINYANYKNVALVAGEGEGKKRKTATGGDVESTGLDRFELYVDARNVSSNDGEISASNYLEMLKKTGVEKLAEYKPEESFEGEIEPMNMFIYGVDYNLGDIVTVTNVYEITANTRIIGVIESLSEEGESVIPTFSSWI